MFYSKINGELNKEKLTPLKKLDRKAINLKLGNI
jgi:hypothetical protein